MQTSSWSSPTSPSMWRKTAPSAASSGDILTAIPPVDVFIGGHIPGDYAQVIGETCVLKAGFAEASLGHARLVFDLEQRKVVERSCQIIHTDPNAQGRPEIAAFVDEVVGPFEAILNEPLAVAEELWEMTLARECKLGDFLADCMRFGGQTQLAYMNATSSGGRIEPGVVTRENFISVSRFNDPIHVGEITGEQLYELVELVLNQSALAIMRPS